VAAKCEYIFSDFFWFITLVKGRLVSLANAYNQRPSLTTGPDTERNLPNDVTLAGDLLTISDVLKTKEN